MRKGARVQWLALPALLLAGCGTGAGPGASAGGSAATGGSAPAAGATPAEGSLLQAPATLVSTLTAPSLLVQLSGPDNQQLLSLSGSPACDVGIYDVKYETVGAPASRRPRLRR